MKPNVLWAGWALACAASLAAAPALAQHSASGRIAATPAAASAKSDAAADALARADAALNNDGKPAADASASASAPEAASAAASIPVAAPAAAVPAVRPAMPVPALASGPSAAGSLLQTTLALGFVLALLVGAAWFLKRYGPKSITGGTAVKLVGALNVGARERILVVEVGEQWIVVGASPGRMNALATMARQEGEATPLAAQPGLPSANFAEWFKQTIEKRNGK